MLDQVFSAGNDGGAVGVNEALGGPIPKLGNRDEGYGLESR